MASLSPLLDHSINDSRTVQNEDALPIGFRYGKGHIRFEKFTDQVDTTGNRHHHQKEAPHINYQAILYPLPRSVESAETVAREISVNFEEALNALSAEIPSNEIPVVHAIRNHGMPGRSDLEQFRVSDSSKNLNIAFANMIESLLLF